MPTSTAKPSTRAGILFAWLFVGIPLAWGVFQTIQKARNLF